MKLKLNTKKTYKIWCEDCEEWVSDFIMGDNNKFICCMQCENGLVMIE